MKHLRLFPAVVPLLFTACTTTTAYRHKNGSLTISQRGINATSTTYWITGAADGRISGADGLQIFRKYRGKSLPAVPVRCIGYVDATQPKRLEVRLVETQGGAFAQAALNGEHKLVDENAPKPFYHWLIP